MIGVCIDAALGLAACLVILLVVPNPFRQGLRDLLRIRRKRLENQVKSPIERELEMVAGPEAVIEQSQSKLQDLRGALQHESNVLMQREDGLSAAEAAYFKGADDKQDSGIDELVMLVAEAEQEVAMQKGVVEGIQTAVSTACAAVDKARKDLRRAQMTIKSDEGKAKATQALDAAARVMEAARDLTADGSKFREASNEVNTQFGTAQARLEGLEGTPAERELRQMADRQQLDELRRRLDAKRAPNTEAH